MPFLWPLSQDTANCNRYYWWDLGSRFGPVIVFTHLQNALIGVVIAVVVFVAVVFVVVFAVVILIVAFVAHDAAAHPFFSFQLPNRIERR